ncbi:MAG: hypothetical protein IT236_01540 [Bacteroidia bacterium]|nr:hypothetical protein [Bacteroidia bacterium]
MAQVQFIEVQKVTSWWGIALALFSPALFTLILIYQMSTGILVGDNPASNGMLMGMIVGFGVPAVLLITRLKLTTIIDSEKISYGFNFPTARLNEIKITDIKECYLTVYGFVGLGYHLSRKYGTVYNISGRKGIQIVKHSGEKILIGSQKWDELKAMFEARQEN